MSILATASRAFEAAPLPDAISRLAIRTLVSNGARRMANPHTGASQAFAKAMSIEPIARATAIANQQHYEVPTDFFRGVLGPQRKYSCCYYERESMTLAQAEEAALAITARHAALADGQTILELGCGWGSLSLWMARHMPNSTILAVSNSVSQRAFIEQEAHRLGLNNLQVVTADMNTFDIDERFDRVVSVEMFEHMANWRQLLQRVRGWLQPDGQLFIHVFTHTTTPYAFDGADSSDWIAQHFFTGGIMPSHDLIHQFADLVTVEQEWRWNGRHYARTASHWLENFDNNRDEIRAILQPVHLAEVEIWMRRWRLFFLATAGLFGHGNGDVWGVSHYRMKRT